MYKEIRFQIYYQELLYYKSKYIVISKPTTIKEYIDQLPAERKSAFTKLRKTIKANIPKGFKEGMGYGMPAYFVPLSSYPDGYHCNPSLPVPFINIANQKNFIALYHSGIYADTKLYDWFIKEYPNHCERKLDMGKSCIRFKKVEEIPYDLIAELMQKMSMKQWIDIYETNIKKK